MSVKDKNDLQLLDDAPQIINADLRKFNRSEQMVLAAVTALTAITIIENKEQLDDAMQVLKEAKIVENKIEAKRKELVKPFNDAVKKINDHAKALVITLPVAIDNCKKVVLAFQKAEEDRVKKERYVSRANQLLSLGFTLENTFFSYADSVTVFCYQLNDCDDAQWSNAINYAVEEINQLKAKEHQQQVQSNEDDDMFGTDDVIAPTLERQTIVAPVAVAPVQEATKVKGVTKRWTFELTNLKELPIEYLQVNEKAIREAIAKGIRVIPGVRIYQEDSLTIR